MPKEDADPTMLCVRLKHGKITVLLLADPFTTFSTIKADLLEILHERYPTGLPSTTSPNPIPLPESAVDIILGVSSNSIDPSQGVWSELDTTDLMHSLRDQDLKDNCLLAFTFSDADVKGFPRFSIELPSYPDDEPMDEELADEGLAGQAAAGQAAPGREILGSDTDEEPMAE